MNIILQKIVLSSFFDEFCILTYIVLYSSVFDRKINSEILLDDLHTDRQFFVL